MPPEREMRIPADTVYRQIVVTFNELAQIEHMRAEVYHDLEDAGIPCTPLVSIRELGIIAF